MAEMTRSEPAASNQIHAGDLGPHRWCIASALDGPPLLFCTLPVCYMAFCGFDRDFGKDVDDTIVLPRYPCCGGCNTGKNPSYPLVECPCCVSAAMWTAVFPLLCVASYVGECSAPGLALPPQCCGGGYCCIGKGANGLRWNWSGGREEGQPITSCINCNGKEYGVHST